MISPFQRKYAMQIGTVGGVVAMLQVAASGDNFPEEYKQAAWGACPIKREELQFESPTVVAERLCRWLHCVADERITISYDPETDLTLVEGELS